MSTNDVEESDGAIVAGDEFRVGDERDGSEQEAFFDAGAPPTCVAGGATGAGGAQWAESV